MSNLALICYQFLKCAIITILAKRCHNPTLQKGRKEGRKGRREEGKRRKKGRKGGREGKEKQLSNYSLQGKRL